MITKRNIDKVLLIIQEHEKTGSAELINSSKIAGKINFSIKEINELLIDLELREFIGLKKTAHGDYGVWLKSYGKKRLAERDDSSNGATHYYIGAIIQVLTGENIQAVGLSHQSDISQIVNDPESLRSHVQFLSDQIIAAIKTDLKSTDLNDYNNAVIDLRNQLLSDDPNPNLIKNFLGTLSFLGDVDGTLSLMKRVWPYISSLLLLATQIIGNIN